MNVKKHITALGFIPKNGTSGIYHKIYSDHDNYVISIDFDKEHIEYGDKIIAESKTTQNCLRESKCLTDCIKAPYFAPDNRSRCLPRPQLIT